MFTKKYLQARVHFSKIDGKQIKHKQKLHAIFMSLLMVMLTTAAAPANKLFCNKSLQRTLYQNKTHNGNCISKFVVGCMRKFVFLYPMDLSSFRILGGKNKTRI